MMMSMRLSGKKNIALLGAFCLFLSAVEYMIPKPLPFMRIGLANLPVMLALDILPFPAFLVLIVIKVIGQALITGTLFSYIFLFSAAGTFSSALLMYALRRVLKRRITFVGIGTAGAFVSGIAQIALSYVLLFRENARYIAPAMLAAGLVTGIALGIFCEMFANRSQWFDQIYNRGVSLRKFKNNYFISAPINSVSSVVNKNIRIFSAQSLFFTGLLIVPSVLFNPFTEYRVLQFLFFWILVRLSGIKTNFLLTIVVTACIILFNLIIPYGRILFSIGPFKITSGSLTAGIHRAATLQALVMLSKLSIRRDLKIPGALGEILGESLVIFSCLTAQKKKLKGKNIIAKIDSLLMELSEESFTVDDTPQQKTTAAGYVILAVVAIISWLPWVKFLLNF